MIEIKRQLRYVILLVSISCLLSNKAYSQNPMELPLEILKVVLVDQNTTIPIQYYSLSDRFVEPFHQNFHSETNYIQNLYHDLWIIGYKGETRSFRIHYPDRKDIKYKKAEGDIHLYFEKLRKQLSNDALIYDEYKLVASPIIIHWEDLEPISNPWQSPERSLAITDIQLFRQDKITRDSLTSIQETPAIEEPTKLCDSLIYLQVMDFDYQSMDFYKAEVLLDDDKVELPFYQVSDFNRIFLIPEQIRCEVQSYGLSILISANGYLQDTLTVTNGRFQASTILYKPGQLKIYVNGSIPFIDLGDQYIVYVESHQVKAYKAILKKYNLKIIEQHEFCRFDKNRVIHKGRLAPNDRLNDTMRKAMVTEFVKNEIQIGPAFQYSHNKQIEGIKALNIAVRINEKELYSNRDSIMSFLKNSGFENVATDYSPIAERGNQQKRYLNTRATLPPEMDLNQLRQFINSRLYPNNAVLGISFENIEITCPSHIPHIEIEHINEKMPFDPKILNSDEK